MTWSLVFSRDAQQDARKLARAGLRPKSEASLAVLRDSPFPSPPPYEDLVGDLSGACSRRIHIQHRLVCEVVEADRVVKVLGMWTHDE